MGSWIERLRDPRLGMVVMTAVVALLMAAHWTPLALTSLAVLALAGLRPHLVVHPAVWWVMAALWLAASVLFEARMEDHVYLFTAWLVALAVSLDAGDDDSFVQRAAWQARMLIGVAFGAAVAWKLYFGDYVTGTALWLLMVVDDRFGPLRNAVGLSSSTVSHDRAALRSLLDGTVETVTLDASDTTAWRIAALAVGTLVIELVIAVAHLAPDTRRLARLRLPSIVVFGVATYAVVPVVPFAALLALLAIVVAGWSRSVFWVFPVMFLVSVTRLLLIS